MAHRGWRPRRPTLLDRWHGAARRMAVNIVALVLLAVLLRGGAANAASSPAPSRQSFAWGWNGLAARPPLAWRTYNAQYLGMEMDQRMMAQSIDALTARNRTVDGANTSLWDMGYRQAGIDGGSELCAADGHSHHDPLGNPRINTKLFPDMRALVTYGRSKGVGVGWYQNDCGCTETVELRRNYAGDVRALDTLGFSGIKYDNCAVMRNMSLYARLMNATNKSFLIENCHWGICTDDDTSSCPTRDWCPFNFYRTSGDIRETWNSFVRNLLTTVRFLDAEEPLSGPHCWAYPDMLQVGNLQSYAHDRANFGSWIIISAPLYLSFDLRDQRRMERVWPLITNKEALAISQQYAGHPGRLVRSWNPPPRLSTASLSESAAAAAEAAATSDSSEEIFVVTADLHSCQQGWSYDSSTGQIRHKGSGSGVAAAVDLDAAGCITVPADGNASLGSTYYDDAALVLRPCSPATRVDPAQRFHRSGDSYFHAPNMPGSHRGTGIRAAPPRLYIRAQHWYEGAGVQLTPQQGRLFFTADGTLQTSPGSLEPDCTQSAGSEHCAINFASDVCVNVSPTMDHGAALLLWAKPQPKGAVAVFLLNNHPTSRYANVEVRLTEVGMKAGQEATVRDVWRREGVGSSVDGIVKLTVPARDSALVLLTPHAGT